MTACFQVSAQCSAEAANVWAQSTFLFPHGKSPLDNREIGRFPNQQTFFGATLTQQKFFLLFLKIILNVKTRKGSLVFQEIF